MHKTTNKKLDMLPDYTIHRNDKFAICKAYTKKFRKHYLIDLIEPFTTLISGFGMVLLSPIQLIANIWDMIPKLYIIKEDDIK